jgi:type IV secretion system protein TrbI
VWARLIMRNGRSTVLERRQGVGAGGYSGLEVVNHWAELYKAALLSTILALVQIPAATRISFRLSA